MAISDALLAEFDHEMGTTRRLLDRVPEAQFGWKPHDRSMSLAQLSGHIANIPHWCTLTIATPMLDLATIGDRPQPPASAAELMSTFDRQSETARAAIAGCSDGEMQGRWTLRHGGQELFTMPRITALRMFVMNHLIHHRGQLSVYLRMHNVSLPPIYGPTADEGS